MRARGRQPVFGMVGARSRVSGKVDPPVGEGERTLFFAPSPGITFTAPIPGAVPSIFTIENSTDRLVAYSFLVVPAWVTTAARHAATFRWQEFFEAVRQPGGVRRALEALAQRMAQLPPPEDGSGET